MKDLGANEKDILDAQYFYEGHGMSILDTLCGNKLGTNSGMKLWDLNKNFAMVCKCIIYVDVAVIYTNI